MLMGTAAFDQFFDAEIAPFMQELDETRQATERKATIVTWTFSALTVLIAAVCANAALIQRTTELDILAFPAIAAAGTFVLRRFILKGYTNRVKELLVPRVLAHFGTFDYTHKPARTAFRHITTNGLLPSHTSAKSEDLITGQYRGQPISIVDVTLERKQGKNSKTVFQGLVVQCAYPHALTGEYSLRPNGIGLGDLFSSLTGTERIKLESPAFEDQFDFYGTDQVEGRTLLTPRQMERWERITGRTSASSISAIFRDGNIYLAIYRHSNWLDSGLYAARNADLRVQTDEIARDLHAIFSALDIIVFSID